MEGVQFKFWVLLFYHMTSTAYPPSPPINRWLHTCSRRWRRRRHLHPRGGGLWQRLRGRGLVALGPCEASRARGLTGPWAGPAMKDGDIELWEIQNWNTLIMMMITMIGRSPRRVAAVFPGRDVLTRRAKQLLLLVLLLTYCATAATLCHWRGVYPLDGLAVLAVGRAALAARHGAVGATLLGTLRRPLRLLLLRLLLLHVLLDLLWSFVHWRCD